MGRKFRWDAAAGKLVEVGKDWTPRQALHAPVMSGRFFENTKSIIDGSDIGSRKKYLEHNKKHNVTHASDFSDVWRENVVKEREREDDRDRVETLKRATYEVFNRRK